MLEIISNGLFDTISYQWGFDASTVVMLQLVLVLAATIIVAAITIQTIKSDYELIESVTPLSKSIPDIALLALAARNSYTQAQVADKIAEFADETESLVQLLALQGPINTPPFVFRNKSAFVIPISPEIPGSPPLDYSEQISTVIFRIKTHLFILGIMACTYGPLVSTGTLAQLEYLVNNTEIRESVGRLRQSLDLK